MSTMTGETISTIRLPRGIKGVLPLDHSTTPSFALLKDTAISIINESGAILFTIKIKKGSEVLAKDIQKLGYLQLIVSGVSSFTVIDPALGTSTEAIRGAPPLLRLLVHPCGFGRMVADPGEVQITTTPPIPALDLLHVTP